MTDPTGRERNDASDPYARLTQVFPKLSAAMLHRAALYGTALSVDAGKLLFERGQRLADFFIVLDAEVEIVYTDEAGSACVVTVHGAGEFTGEMDLLGGGSNLVTARVRRSGTVLRIARSAFAPFVSAEPDIGEIVMRALILRRMGFVLHDQASVVVVGNLQSSDMLRIRRFLTRNNYPHRVLDVDLELDVLQVLTALDLSPRDLPAVIAPGLPPLGNPSLSALSDALGLTEAIDRTALHDVLVVGGGPAGLAAAVYAASEGLRTVVIEGLAPGGQAGTSSRIENFLGFPTGISGHALASRAQVQAQKFGARLLIPRTAQRLEKHGASFTVSLDDGTEVSARVVVIATGARYRRPAIPDFEHCDARGIHYAATPMEAQLCSARDVVVLGGGNSAGQAAVYLARHARHVHVVIRGERLSDTMSDYLVQRIAASSAITLYVRTEIVGLGGQAGSQQITCRHRDTGDVVVHVAAGLFVMIGAEPNTGWVQDAVRMDDRGFVCTGRDATGCPGASAYETSQAGTFAVGDVRSGSVKRVAASVGEGSIVVQDIHRYLDALGA